MLVLSRHPQQTVQIHTSDGLIEISINQIKGRRVQLGITAPEEVLILRDEVTDSSRYEEY